MKSGAQMNSNSISKFYSYLDELEVNYSRLKDLLHLKLMAIAQNDLGKLDDIIKEEQVYVLLSKGFDSNINMYREKLNLTGPTLSAVIDELPPLEQTPFRQLLQRLQITLAQVKNLNEKCQSMIEEKLYSLDKSIKSLDHSDSHIYQKPGSEDSKMEASSCVFTKVI